jgi:hypothetical protein
MFWIIVSDGSQHSRTSWRLHPSSFNVKGFQNTSKKGCIQDLWSAATVIIQIKFNQSQQPQSFVCNAVQVEVLTLPAACFCWFVFLFYREDGSDMLLRSFGISPNYIVLQPRWHTVTDVKTLKPNKIMKSYTNTLKFRSTFAWNVLPMGGYSYRQSWQIRNRNYQLLLAWQAPRRSRPKG